MFAFGFPRHSWAISTNAAWSMGALLCHPSRVVDSRLRVGFSWSFDCLDWYVIDGKHLLCWLDIVGLRLS